MRKIFGWIISIAGLGGYLVNKANWIANRLSFLSLPGDLCEALIEMSHIPTLISISLLIVGVTGIIFWFMTTVWQRMFQDGFNGGWPVVLFLCL